MKTRILLASAVALAFAAGTVALPSLADAAQQFHGGGGHAGGGRGGGYHGGGGYRMGGAYHGGGYHGGGGAGTATVAAASTTAACADRCRWSWGSAALTAIETGSPLRAQTLKAPMDPVRGGDAPTTSGRPSPRGRGPSARRERGRSGGDHGGAEIQPTTKRPNPYGANHEKTASRLRGDRRPRQLNLRSQRLRRDRRRKRRAKRGRNSAHSGRSVRPARRPPGRHEGGPEPQRRAGQELAGLPSGDPRRRQGALGSMDSSAGPYG